VEQLHVPWMIRFPDGRGQLARSSALTTHLDVLPTLLNWVDDGTQDIGPSFDGMSILPIADDSSHSSRDTFLFASDDKFCSIRSASWSLLGHLPDAAESHRDAVTKPSPELFVHPDDRWEANDVAKLCPDVVEELQTAAKRAWRDLSNGDRLAQNYLPSATP
jgi:arylsulfatase A-like enzyme